MPFPAVFFGSWPFPPPSQSQCSLSESLSVFRWWLATGKGDFMSHKNLQNIKKTSKLFSQYLVCKTHVCVCVCVCVCVLVAQSCLTLCKPMDCSPPGSSIYGILQARILEWVAIPFSRGSSWTRDQTWVSCTAGRFFTIWATREAWNMCISSKPDNSFLALKLSVDSLYSKQIHTQRDIFYKIIEEKPISHVGLAI